MCQSDKTSEDYNNLLTSGLSNRQTAPLHSADLLGAHVVYYLCRFVKIGPLVTEANFYSWLWVDECQPRKLDLKVCSVEKRL